jgi:cytochrome oxidase Cu insertion factor (SCO1/SenC/PrrC family)
MREAEHIDSREEADYFTSSVRKIAILSRSISILILVVLVATPASAHKFGGPNDPCERKIGASLIHITLYQPEFDPDAEYCDQIPRAGNTVLVVDTMGEKLRRVRIGVQILADDAASDHHAVLAIRPAVYRRGVVDAQVDLVDGRRYIAKVMIASEEGSNLTVYSFPIRVQPWYHALVVPALMVLAVFAFIGISIVQYRTTQSRRRRRRSPALPRAAAIVLALLWTLPGCNRARPDTATLPDVRLVDDHGHSVDIQSLKGKVVLLDFVHIGCPGVCDTLISKFGEIADSIGPELGSQVVLVTVTNAPEHDRPDLLLKLAQDRQADIHGWLFLTGKPEDVRRLTDALRVDNRRLPDGSPNHIARVFMLGPDLREQHEYQGMAMNSKAVAAELKSQVKAGGA